jgi:Methyltransferase domain
MDIRIRLRKAAPYTYRRARRGYHLARLAGHILRGDEDMVDFLKDFSIKSHGTSKKRCPLCGFIGALKAWGSPPRWNALCPSCGSLERHRHLALFLQRTPALIKDGAVVLHFAPENCVTTLLRKSRIHHIGADLIRDDVDLKINIENIAVGNEQCDIIICSHVLEHVVDDKRALSELWRILKPNGRLIIMVPTNGGCEMTYEDNTIKDRDQRLIHFGDADHVRIYGADFVQKLTDAGFHVKVTTAFGKEAVRYGLIMGDKIFLCKRAT